MTRRFWVYIEQEEGKVHRYPGNCWVWRAVWLTKSAIDAVVEGILVGHQMEEAGQGSHSLRRGNSLCGG